MVVGVGGGGHLGRDQLLNHLPRDQGQGGRECGEAVVAPPQAPQIAACPLPGATLRVAAVGQEGQPGGALSW